MQKELLLISLFFCHWLADYTHLSTMWMLNAKKLGKPLFPIFVHAGVHTTLMSVVLWWIIGFNTLWIYLILFQWGTHFLIDVCKGRMNGWFPMLQNPANKAYWIIFGFDQLLHALVIIFMAYYALLV